MVAPDPLNREHVYNIREALADKARVLAFLGAGLSFGAARLSAKRGFEAHSHDDALPLPSWPLLGEWNAQAVGGAHKRHGKGFPSQLLGF